MWWTLPTEIVSEILQHVLVDDYVALTQTSSALRLHVDTSELFRGVVEARLGDDLRGYELDLRPGKRQVWRALNETRRALDRVEAAFPGPAARGTEAGAAAEARVLGAGAAAVARVLGGLVASDTHVVAILLEMRAAMASYEQGAVQARRRAVDVPVARLAWCRKLFQLHSFARAAEFFMGEDAAQAQDVVRIEQCYFELSRCYNDFAELARHRARVRAEIQAALRPLLPGQAAGLDFPTSAAYRAYLARVIQLTLGRLRAAHYTAGFGGNILRLYKGLGGGTHMPYMAIVARVLSEDVLRGMPVRVAGRRLRGPAVALTPVFLVVGLLYVLVLLEEGSCTFYERRDMHRMPEALRPGATGKICTRDVLQRAFESGAPGARAAPDMLARDWATVPLSSSLVKLRFLRTVLLHVCDRRPLDEAAFRLLIHNPDFHLYFHAASRVCGAAAPSFRANTEYLGYASQPVPADAGFAAGDFVANHSSDYFGVVLGPEPNVLDGSSLLSTLPFDDLEKSMALYSSVQHLRVADFGDGFVPFLRWLVTTDGFMYTSMFLSPVLRVTEEKLCFVPARAAA
ncbi:hypothetical protein METBIDRAFT_102149 [Metschnikowia bicuspidata var. bicuspidata NRRL YB-4993]|uniref:F-box domain-containing protein n=1 Tax=Metschnikowia bicuspidata var. bicuspidata NRRL YB-4993 TaxID=869754 RepID=A0A1A0HH66_9ASCO|nr:hypothetical protein METBIDRAFT_102149 [Metschnikowia bicuspidata var. bicuspidata NRRL YB-4993]OBA23222.1 hypothetical protein METBIDRAFT_102149 [Metschnikowia bicuspidata var. bicuspidata NRRL YB-4993]